MKRMLTAVIVLLSCIGTAAQNNNAIRKWKFNSINQVGLLQGEGHTAMSIQSVNGFRRGHLFGGLGTGLDYYRYRTIPLFAEARWYFGSTADQFFIYGNGGTNFVWQERMFINGADEIFHPGFYSGAGIGFKAGLKNGMGIVLSAGYTHKNVSNSRQEISFCPIAAPCVFSAETYRYNFNRLIFQLGWLF